MIHPQLTRAKFIYTKSSWTEYLPNLDPEITEVPIRCDLWEQQLLHEPLNEKTIHEYGVLNEAAVYAKLRPISRTKYLRECVSSQFALPNL